MTDEKTEFGTILKELRLEKQMGQVELANALGVSKGIISLWENSLREPGLSSLIAIARFLTYPSIIRRGCLCNNTGAFLTDIAFVFVSC